MILLALLGCTPVTEEPVNTGTEPVEDSGADPQAAALPTIWGVAPAEDFDPDPGVVEVHLSAAEAEMSWVDGGDTTVWAYNGQVPGPLIQVPKGALVRVVLTNDMPEDETTIHWHGLRIDDEMDGVPAIQDPVQPGESFTYEFSPPDTGSFWYHPHVRANEQIEHGLQGPLVVHEASPVAVDTERAFVMDDVALRSGGTFYPFNLANSHMDAMHGRYGNVLLVNGSPDVLTDTVRPGGIERWRIVNTANARTMYIDVTGAAWRVIALDGTLLPEPYETDTVVVPVGRRVDLEVIPDLDADQVELRFKTPGAFEGAYSSQSVFDGVVDAAPWDGEPGAGEQADWGGSALPDIEDTVQEVVLEFDGVAAGSSIDWMVNGETYDDSEPIMVDANVPTRITITELSGQEHPFHLHGQFFQVMSRNGEPTDEPGLLDTVLIDGRDTVELYTTFDNPGRWLAHCHILEHAELGMMREMDVGQE